MMTYLMDDGFRFFVAGGEPVAQLGEECGTGSLGLPRYSCVDILFENRTDDASIAALEPRVTRVNYFHGADPAKWHVNVPTFGAVRYQGIGKDLDVVARKVGGVFEYDFVLGAKAMQAEGTIRIRGARGIDLLENDELRIRTLTGELRHTAPIAFETLSNGEKHPIECHLDRIDDERFAIRAERSVPGSIVTIDPQVTTPPAEYFFSYVGGKQSEVAFDVAVNAGHTVITGTTLSGGDNSDELFPVGSSLIGSNAFDTVHNGHWDAFVARLDDVGQILWCSYLGGNPSTLPNFDIGKGVDVDAAGSVYVCGITNATITTATCGGTPCACPPGSRSVG